MLYDTAPDSGFATRGELEDRDPTPGHFRLAAFF